MKNLADFCFTRFIALALMLVIAGCGGGADESSSNTNLRMLNLSTGYESVDLYASNDDSVTDKALLTGVTLGTMSSYTAFKGDTYTLNFRKSGTTGILATTAVNLPGGNYLTMITYGATNRFALDVIDDNVEAPSTGYTKMLVLNTSMEQSFDVYLTGADDSLDDVSATIGGNSPRSQNSTTVTSGTYRLRITKSGDKADVRLNVPQLVLSSAGVVNVIIAETDGGVLVKAIVLPKRGQPTTYESTTNASFRVLNVSNAYSPLDVYSANSAGDAEVQRFTSIARGTATNYAALPADTYALRFRRSGAAGNLLSLNSTLASDRHTTYVTYGTTNHFAVLPIEEEVTKPDAGYTKIQVLNTTSADSLDVYLTDANDSLDSVSAVISAAKAGEATGFTTTRHGMYRLRVTRGGEKLDLRLDVPSITLADQGVMSIVLSETTGGVLLDAVLLPQQADPVRLDNGNIRIRGAVGLPSGSLATVSLGTTQIVSGRSARSFIADAYTILPAGTVSATVSVDGVQTLSQSLVLQPGRDYTLLAWGSGGDTRVTLISDSNFASTTQRPRLRLLNGASGLAAPLTLLAGYSPTAEYIHPGASSDVAELLFGTDVRLDVLNSDTLATVLTRESVTLLADGVYTLFVAGGGGSAVSGTLRKDR